MSSQRALCLVCGFADSEVKKMHYFPSALKKSKIWQENMGIVFSGDSLRNHRICSRHFKKECYVDCNSYKLRTDAVPTLYGSSSVASSSASQVEVSTIIGESEGVVKEMLGTNIDLSLASVQEVPKEVVHSRPTRRSVFRGIQNLSTHDTTPRKKYLMDMVYKKEDHIRKLKQLCKDRSHDIKALSELTDSKVVRSLFKNMPSRTTNFLISQLRCASRNPKGRRWTVDEKVVALALFKRSPRCYNLLRKIVAMPSRRTVLALLEKVPFDIGINEHLFRHINNSISSENDRCCVLLFDEMDIMEHIDYNIAKDRIIGYEDMGEDSHKYANRALVFMCQGLARNWKQPVAYYFSNNGCSSLNLIKCLKEVLYAAKHIAGLDVVATVCDMGSSNVKALKDLQSSVEKPYFEYDGKKIFTMFDPPHLLKCTVSLFRKHSVLLPISVGEQEQIMEAKFSDIKEAYERNKETPLIFRALHKIKDTHMAPVMRFAMKVNIAAQIMSRTVAAYLYTLLSLGETEQRSLATATFVQQADELFDSFNGNRVTAPDGKAVRCCVTEDSPHLNYWKKAFHIVKNWNFRRITKLGNLRAGKPPSQIGWLVSIRAIQGVWNYLKKKGFTMLRPRSLNQDALENLFGAVRSGCGSGDNPTCSQFMGSLKTQILNGLTNQALSGTNCEEDENVLLSNLVNFLTVNEEMNVDNFEDLGVAQLKEPAIDATDIVASEIANAVAHGNVEILSVAYVSGFIAKRLIKEMKCEVCQHLLHSQQDELHNQFIAYKEWSEETRKLTYPSENLVVAVGHAVTELENILPNFGGNSGVGKFAAQQIRQRVNFSWVSCAVHQDIMIEGILKAVCRIGIPWWCKRQNHQIRQQRKDDRAAKRKVTKFQHQ